MSKNKNKKDDNMKLLMMAAVVAVTLLTKYQGNGSTKSKGGSFTIKDYISMAVAALALLASVVSPFIKYNNFQSEVTFSFEKIKSDIDELRKDQDRLQKVLDDKVLDCKSDNYKLKESIRSLETSIQNIYSTISNIRKNKR